MNWPVEKGVGSRPAGWRLCYSASTASGGKPKGDIARAPVFPAPTVCRRIVPQADGGVADFPLRRSKRPGLVVFKNFIPSFPRKREPISVIPAKAGIQNCLLSENDVVIETPGFPRKRE